MPNIPGRSLSATASLGLGARSCRNVGEFRTGATAMEPYFDLGGLTWRCSSQSSPAASSASWMRCHAALSDSSSRMRTCPRWSGICVPRPRCLATAASSSSARLPGRITWTTIAVSGTRADRSRGPSTHPARATRFRRHRPGSSGHLRQAASSKKKDLAGRARLRWVEVSAARGQRESPGISSDRSRGSCGRPLPSLS